jgi:hypothetical protein
MLAKSSCIVLSTRSIACWISAILLVSTSACFGAENLWDVLKRESKGLDVLALDSLAGDFALVGVKYLEIPWVSQENPEVSPLLPPVVRKQLYIFRVAPNDAIVWRQTYPALPDVQEIFSIDATFDQRLCIVFGEQRGQEAILNPVLLQVDGAGKILWAKRNVISSLKVNSNNAESAEEISNLDTLRVVASSANGCLLAFVSRQFINQAENYLLHLIQYLPDGNIRWHKTLATEMYGKLFLVNNKAADQYVVIQTNQSRDAAIEAMMLGMPFVPQTSVVGIDYEGEVLFQKVNPGSLSNLWVKDVIDTPGDAFIIAGKTKSAWVGQLSSSGKVLSYIDAQEGEFNAVSKTQSGGYLFARGDSLTLMDKDQKTFSSQKIQAVTTHQFVNQYLLDRLPGEMPVEQMMLVHHNEYLLLYELGSKLLKVRIEKSGE